MLKKPWDIFQKEESKTETKYEEGHPFYGKGQGGADGPIATVPDLGQAAPSKVEESEGRQASLEEEAAATRGELAETAGDRTEAGESERVHANEKSDALYAALSAFANKQEGRYDTLYDMVFRNDYKSNAGAAEILYGYLANGGTAAGHTYAGAAGQNNGNGDTYAAALSASTKNEYARTGDAAARQYYGEQLDRMLAVLQAASGDMTDIYGAMQDNIDTAQDTANRDLSIGADLLATLIDAQESAKKNEANIYSDLLGDAHKYSDASISPMELDTLYKELTEGKDGLAAMSPSNALVALWNKYPDMRSYIMQKYSDLSASDYTF